MFRFSILLCLGFYLLCTGCRPAAKARFTSERDRYIVADTLLGQIKSGDLVLRCGKDQLSQLFRNLNRNHREYAHCGIAQQTDSGCFVYHIIGGADNPEAGMVYEPLGSFVRPGRIERWGIARFSLPDSARQICCRTASRLQKEGVRFDTRFDLSTREELYCTELVYRCLSEAGLQVSQTLSRSGKPYISMDDLLAPSCSKIVFEIVFK